MICGDRVHKEVSIPNQLYKKEKSDTETIKKVQEHLSRVNGNFTSGDPSLLPTYPLPTKIRPPEMTMRRDQLSSFEEFLWISNCIGMTNCKRKGEHQNHRPEYE